MRSVCTCVLALLLASAGFGGEIPEVIRLWPGTAPGSARLSLTETTTERPAASGRKNRAITQITDPTLVTMRPKQPNGAAVIIAPGGGWQRLAFDLEGLEPARWLNERGVTAFVLKYRLATEGHDHPFDVALQDAQRAVRLVRKHAASWGLDPQRLGFMGFSAGGHLAASIGFFSERPVYSPIDDADTLPAKPDFLIIGYAPAGELESLKDGFRNELLRAYRIEAAPGATYPPAFLFHADDDRGVPARNSVQIFLALKQAGARAALHVFQRGGHGFGLGEGRGPVEAWPGLCAAWLRDIGVVR